MMLWFNRDHYSCAYSTIRIIPCFRMLEASWFSISFRNRMFDSRKVSNPNNIVWQIIRKSNKHNYSEHSAINLSKGTLSVFCFLCRLQYLMPLLGHVWSSFGIRLLILRGSLKGNLNAFGLYNAGRYVSLSRIRIGTAPQERRKLPEAVRILRGTSAALLPMALSDLSSPYKPGTNSSTP